MHERKGGTMSQDHRWLDGTSSSLPSSTCCLVEMLNKQYNDHMFNPVRNTRKEGESTQSTPVNLGAC